MRCYLGLGSNLNDPAAQLRCALSTFSASADVTLVATSRWYQNPAVGPGEQPDYLNGVIAIDTDLSPEQLLSVCQAVETAQGRVRDVRWGARTLDVDLLLYGNKVVNLPHLQIPHPRLRERNFVLYPLADLAPGLVLPDGTCLSALLAQYSAEGLTVVEDLM